MKTVETEVIFTVEIQSCEKRSSVVQEEEYRFKLDDHLQVPFFPMTLFITVVYPTEKELKYHFRMLSEIWHNLDEKRVKFSESVQLYMHEVAQDQSNQSKLFLYTYIDNRYSKNK
ncbi:hypothetical protein T02_2477 [Trichinella nativa]|uniref:Uncharacterized protein n=1 Tax=Trichinella nativa TaxID=6335 RepID=A0A0V1KTA4_9BILA|nr:hypothetical protein T02_2477 [Trichinella nativa]